MNRKERKKRETILKVTFINNNSRERTKQTVGRRLSKNIIQKIQGNFKKLKDMIFRLKGPTH